MDYSKNKEAAGQNRASEENEMVIRANLSKDSKTLDLTACYLKEYGAKDVSEYDSLKELTNLQFGTNLCGPKGAKWLAQSTVLTNLTTLNLFYNAIDNEGWFVQIAGGLTMIGNENDENVIGDRQLVNPGQQPGKIRIHSFN